MVVNESRNDHLSFHINELGLRAFKGGVVVPTYSMVLSLRAMAVACGLAESPVQIFSIDINPVSRNILFAGSKGDDQPILTTIS